VNHFRDFTAVDIETTDKDTTRAEIVEIAAVRVRNGRIIDEFRSLVRPDAPIAGGAFDTHGISEHDLVDAPQFLEVWPQFREFCGSDVVVAHNGHNFDFPVLRRMAGEAECADLYTYDTLVLARELRTGSASLGNLAHAYGIPVGRAHHALDDTRTLAKVFLKLGEEKMVRARKTAFDIVLDFLGIALALSDRESLCIEAERLRDLT
jgi:DNA polymerase III epsilon subunit family exonuclease